MHQNFLDRSIMLFHNLLAYFNSLFCDNMQKLFQQMLMHLWDQCLWLLCTLQQLQHNFSFNRSIFLYAYTLHYFKSPPPRPLRSESKLLRNFYYFGISYLNPRLFSLTPSFYFFQNVR